MKQATVILNWNGKEDTLNCLASLNALSLSSSSNKIILVDSHSTDGSVQAIRQQYPTIDIVESPTNQGYADGNTMGIKEALKWGADYIFILNNDVIVSDHTISELVSSLKRHEDWGIAAPKIYFSAGREYHKERYQKNDLGHVIWYAGGMLDMNNILASHVGVDEVDSGQFDIPSVTDFASGCAMMIRRSVFEKTGFFDSRYFLYYEDLDFNMRVKKDGFLVGYCPTSYLWHKNSGSTFGSGSPLHDYYITRNRMLFGFSYGAPRAKIALIKESVKLALTGRAWQKRGIFDYYAHRFGKGSYPLDD